MVDYLVKEAQASLKKFEQEWRKRKAAHGDHKVFADICDVLIAESILARDKMDKLLIKDKEADVIYDTLKEKRVKV